ncbi:hypothetical protein [Winogradskyella arenosi]|uniref:Uncharacterized protein n=1 Tax=Winogradskyella arenosi TaxID=533325 RepID=A0A368ZFR0_9FLAO|nr:hypothetical protein [Winogradskyella arenosi]RCW92020.1 hypothetical protein DFQ08_10239 [Winogradskyella arenosi]
MKTLQDIQTQIVQLTTNIEVNYPELYRSLEESPSPFVSYSYPNITRAIMQDYLNGLKQILKQYLKNHNLK